MCIKFTKDDEKYGCFSNSYPCEVYFDGLTFKNSEAAWQAQKVQYADDKVKFTELDGDSARVKGNEVKLRGDWNDIKYMLMVDICFQKFCQNVDLCEILLSTGNEELVFDTTGLHDNLWGDCSCPECVNRYGNNLLGKALMEVRGLLGEL
jgi:hypothetical protein